MTGFDLTDLTASFSGKRVIGPLSLTVNPGDKIALVGKSGAGKSTLIRLIYERINRNSSLIPQDLGLVNALSVFHNVFMGQLDKHPTWYNALTLARPFAKDKADVLTLLQSLGITEKLWTPAASLSGGQRQRVAIARALYRNATVLLADEPVSALDGPMANSVMMQLRDRFTTSIVALHDVSRVYLPSPFPTPGFSPRSIQKSWKRPTRNPAVYCHPALAIFRRSPMPAFPIAGQRCAPTQPTGWNAAFAPVRFLASLACPRLAFTLKHRSPKGFIPTLARC
jgi:phosphonate transport system ATP-binding protein